jgi:hypothetical protein
MSFIAVEPSLFRERDIALGWVVGFFGLLLVTAVGSIFIAFPEAWCHAMNRV